MIRYEVLGFLHDVLALNSVPFIPLYFILLASKGDIVSRIKRGVLPRFNNNKIFSDVVIHSSSIGETKNAVLFSQMLRREFPYAVVSHSVFTRTAEELFGPKVGAKAIPLPFFIFMRKFLSPCLKLLIIFEKDLWPGYVIAAKSLGAGVIIVSGKISSTTQKIWSYFPIITSMVDCVFSADPPEKFRGAGFPYVVPSINLKNIIFLKAQAGEKFDYSKEEEKKIVVAGISLRGNTEIEFLLKFSYEVQQRYGYKISVFLAPRHNFSEAENFLRKRAVNFIKFSEFVSGSGEGISKEKLFSFSMPHFILVDGYGEVEKFLPICDFAFVGGTISNFGGHNALEPIAFGVPTVVGPHIWNIENQDELIKEHVINIVRAPSEFAKLVKLRKKLKSYVLEFSKKKKEIIYVEIKKIFDYVGKYLIK